MTEILLDLNNDRQKRRRVMTVEEFQEENTVRGEKRKRLDNIYEQERAGLETDIIANVNGLLQEMKRRKKLVGKSPTQSSSSNSTTIVENHCACCVTKTEKQAKKYDEETVQAMMSVALETQKEKLFESFIEEHLDFVAQRQQYEDSLLPQANELTYIS